MGEQVSHIFDGTPVHAGSGILHICIGELSSQFSNLKQIHADRIHIVLIRQKGTKVLSETGHGLFNSDAILWIWAKICRSLSEKLI